MASTRPMVRRMRPWKMLKATTAGKRDQEADRGRDQRLGDAGHDHGGAAALVLRESRGRP